MKKEIRTILREGMLKNSLGVSVSRPDQVLIVMRGIPGSGKSTKAKELVGEGVIHSTDTVIESQGDYNKFFELMVESKDFTPLSRAHSTNLKNVVASLKEGVSPVILDNTNIKQNEPKAAVKAALELGLADHNIKFVDVGTGGLTAEQLAGRNTHGVPLEKIKSMIESHKGQGAMTLKSVLESKDMYKQSDILYSAVVLDEGSRAALLSRVDDFIPDDWKVIAHHMTIALGKPVPNQEDLGKQVTLTVTELGLSDMAMAVKVDGYPSTKQIPHVTIAINPDGGKPVMSNDITNWRKIKPFNIMGVVTDVKVSNDFKFTSTELKKILKDLGFHFSYHYWIQDGEPNNRLYWEKSKNTIILMMTKNGNFFTSEGKVVIDKKMNLEDVILKIKTFFS